MENTNRRNFIKTGALIGGGILAAPISSFGSNPGTTPSRKSGENPNLASKERILGTGKHSIKIAQGMGLGCMGMSWNRSFIPDQKPMIDLIRKAYDIGVNFFDTAEAYGAYTNEELIGNAIAPFRNKITLCSKFGFDIKNGKLTGGLNSQPKHIREVVEQSLKRLKTDRIDLLYQHRVDPQVPIDDVAGTVKDLIKEGKVLNFGLSEANAETIRKAHAIQQLTAIQTEYSLMSRDPEKDILGVCEELGIGFVPYSPLCRAYLTGYINERSKYNAANDNRGSLPRYQKEAVIANWAMIDVITDFGNKRGLTAAQVSLAWLSAQKPWIVSIPGTTKLAHLQENLWSTDFQFTPEELNKFTDDISKIKITGNRY
jgi:aryl-alcohol dehydrogenase-like predicted oxidoreductase